MEYSQTFPRPRHIVRLQHRRQSCEFHGAEIFSRKEAQKAQKLFTEENKGNEDFVIFVAFCSKIIGLDFSAKHPLSPSKLVRQKRLYFARENFFAPTHHLGELFAFHSRHAHAAASAC